MCFHSSRNRAPPIYNQGISSCNANTPSYYGRVTSSDEAPPSYDATISTDESGPSHDTHIMQTQPQQGTGGRGSLDAITNNQQHDFDTPIEAQFKEPNSPDARGVTPLLAAVQAGDAEVVKRLIEVGADVDKLGIDPKAAVDFGDKNRHLRTRTPLQLASANGNLVLVKLLMENCNANDALVAGDGYLAWRLAVKNGHHDIVAYLPVRRGGEWRRWKLRHEVLMERATTATKAISEFFAFFLWHIPKLVIWTLPKWIIVKPVAKSVTWAWENKRQMGKWLRKQLTAFPKRIRKVAETVVTGVKGFPHRVGKVVKAFLRLVKALPRAAKSIIKWIWRIIRSTPKAVYIIAKYIWLGVQVIGSGIYSSLCRLVSLLHTLSSFVLTVFRGVTLHDVFNGIMSLLKAIFIDLPKAIYGWSCMFGETSYKVLKALFHWFGVVLWYLAAALVAVVTHVPKNVVVVIWSVLSSVLDGFGEFMSWINPKW